MSHSRRSPDAYHKRLLACPPERAPSRERANL
jgi:hypothetical protein